MLNIKPRYLVDEAGRTHLEENRARRTEAAKRQAEAQARRKPEARLAELEARLQVLQRSAHPWRPDQSEG